MASIKNLKKDINHVLGDIIGACYQWKHENLKADTSKAQEIIDEAIDTFDTLIEKLHTKAENKKAHFKGIQKELEDRATELLEKVNKL